MGRGWAESPTSCLTLTTNTASIHHSGPRDDP
ncbi:hypothetical protein E2C01_051980 [Portunus trituberculatus]|uniref:Uncharacterized protein n=1 Tax=Portunus trituberculatus TaxID=210409 RepID=A0A5B7GLV0_PORTR|nr:hypothetical protein [Portunus trituberculatus]